MGMGGAEGRTDGHMENPPVFYRTSALWGYCPKSHKNIIVFKRFTWKSFDDSISLPSRYHLTSGAGDAEY